MFFLLSKLLHFVLMPFTWVIALLAWSWITKNPGKKRKCFVAGFVLLLIFTNRFLFNNTILLWEIPPSPEPAAGSYDAIIVLGGFSWYNEELDRIVFTSAADRIMQALQLYRAGVAPKLILSSGSGSVTYPDYKEGTRALAYLRKIGVPESALVIENESKNTWENAKLTAALLKKEAPGGRYLLVTSGIHMRRSVGCFSKAGVPCTPYSTDCMGTRERINLDYLLIPQAGALSSWNSLIHEWVGCIAYKFAGYN